MSMSINICTHAPFVIRFGLSAAAGAQQTPDQHVTTIMNQLGVAC